MQYRITTRVVAGLGLLLAAACGRGFQVAKFPEPVDLFAASMAEYRGGKFDNAIAGFEKLTMDLSARDTLLPLSHWYLAWSHEKKNEHVLAATSFSRLAESFPDDSLADDALLEAGNSYRRIWRSVELDPQYGTLSQVQYRTLLSVYPESPLRARADSALLALDEMYAEKDYRNGVFYMRLRAYDSAIIYFKDVVKLYPNTDRARMALLRLVEVYRRPAMNYKEEAAETCATLRAAYPMDAEVKLLCPPGGTPADSSAARKPPA